jgi:hypothetical protein
VLERRLNVLDRIAVRFPARGARETVPARRQVVETVEHLVDRADGRADGLPFVA